MLYVLLQAAIIGYLLLEAIQAFTVQDCYVGLLLEYYSVVIQCYLVDVWVHDLILDISVLIIFSAYGLYIALLVFVLLFSVTTTGESPSGSG